MAWSTSSDAFFWIFNVGRGSAAFLRTPLNQGIILDIGCSQDFSPAAFIADHIREKLDVYEEKRIAQAILTHPHHDHISDCDALLDGGKLSPRLITCPNDKNPDDAVKWDRIKNRDGNKSIEKYKKLYAGRELPLQTIKYESRYTTALSAEYGVYWVRPNVCDDLHGIDNEYGNSLSMVTYFRYGSHSILLPGDITPLAMQKLLAESYGAEKRFTVFSKATQADHPDWTTRTFDQPSLKGRLGTYGLSVLVAPHHGLESCFSPELYEAIRGGKPNIVAISEAYGVGENQGKIDQRYQSKDASTGLTVKMGGKEEFRNSVTTKSNHLLVRFSGSGQPRIYCEPKVEDLMKWANA